MATGFPYQMHSFVLLTMIIAGASAFFSAAIGDDEKKARRIGIILEGSFESPEIYRLPEGASKTILVPFYEWDYGVRSFTQKFWEERNMSWDTFDKIAEALADKLAESVELDVVRNDNDVVEYILIENKDPFRINGNSTAVFADYNARRSVSPATNWSASPTSHSISDSTSLWLRDEER